MRYHKGLPVLFALTFLSLQSASAAPLGSFKGAGASVTAADAVAVDAAVDATTSPSLFTPATTLPDQYGSVKIAYHNQCGLVVMGENSVTPAEAQTALETAAKKGPFVSKIKRSKGSFVLLLCGDGSGGFNVTLVNRDGLAKLLAGKAKLTAGTTITANIKGPNFVASATLANLVNTGGGTILSKDYEVTIGTDAQGQMWLAILDNANGELIGFHPGIGLFHGAYNAAVADIYNRAIGSLRTRPGAIDFIVANGGK